MGEPGAVGGGMVGDRDWPVASGGYEGGGGVVVDWRCEIDVFVGRPNPY